MVDRSDKQWPSSWMSEVKVRHFCHTRLQIKRKLQCGIDCQSCMHYVGSTIALSCRPWWHQCVFSAHSTVTWLTRYDDTSQDVESRYVALFYLQLTGE